jgi:hypothetical protein
MPSLPDDADPVEVASRLSAQAELLAVNAGREALRDPAASGELRQLAFEARELARRGREVAERHRRLAEAEAEAGRVLDEGLADTSPAPDAAFASGPAIDPVTDPAGAARVAVARFLARAECLPLVLQTGSLPH